MNSYSCFYFSVKIFPLLQNILAKIICLLPNFPHHLFLIVRLLPCFEIVLIVSVVTSNHHIHPTIIFETVNIDCGFLLLKTLPRVLLQLLYNILLFRTCLYSNKYLQIALIFNKQRWQDSAIHSHQAIQVMET